MTIDVDVTWVTEESSIDVRPDEPVEAARLLRRFDVLRQRLAVRWCGSAGAFAGYDELQMPGDNVVTAGTVHLEARLMEAGARSHIVESTAIVTGGAAPGEVETTLLTKGRGHTLQMDSGKSALLIRAEE